VALTNRCVTLLWEAQRSDVRRDARTTLLRTTLQRTAMQRTAMQRTEPTGATYDSAAIHGGDPGLCLAMLDAMGAVRTDAQGPDAVRALHRLDSLARRGPYQFGIDFANLVLARLQAQRGDTVSALQAVRRRPYDWDTAPLYLSSYLELEGRLAAATGDTPGARRAFDQWLTLRAGADAPLRAKVDAVRALRARVGR
jgi:hypothetical protein